MRLLLVLILTITATAAQADLVQQFKNPAFSGQGFSSHVLTIETIEKSRRDAVESQKKAEQAALDSAAQNTPLARFMSLFQSQVYSQLATQLTNNLFQNKCSTTDNTCTSPTTGSFALDGNTVTWIKSTNEVTLTVVDRAGTITTVKVPIASFAF